MQISRNLIFHKFFLYKHQLFCAILEQKFVKLSLSLKMCCSVSNSKCIGIKVSVTESTHLNKGYVTSISQNQDIKFSDTIRYFVKFECTM